MQQQSQNKHNIHHHSSPRVWSSVFRSKLLAPIITPKNLRHLTFPKVSGYCKKYVSFKTIKKNTQLLYYCYMYKQNSFRCMGGLAQIQKCTFKMSMACSGSVNKFKAMCVNSSSKTSSSCWDSPLFLLCARQHKNVSMCTMSFLMDAF